MANLLIMLTLSFLIIMAIGLLDDVTCARGRNGVSNNNQGRQRPDYPNNYYDDDDDDNDNQQFGNEDDEDYGDFDNNRPKKTKPKKKPQKKQSNQQRVSNNPTNQNGIGQNVYPQHLQNQNAFYNGQQGGGGGYQRQPPANVAKIPPVDHFSCNRFNYVSICGQQCTVKRKGYISECYPVERMNGRIIPVTFCICFRFQPANKIRKTNRNNNNNNNKKKKNQTGKSNSRRN